MDLNWRQDHLTEENRTGNKDGDFARLQFALNERVGERNRFSMLCVSCLTASRKDNEEVEQAVIVKRKFVSSY